MVNDNDLIKIESLVDENKRLKEEKEKLMNGLQVASNQLKGVSIALEKHLFIQTYYNFSEKCDEIINNNR
jgi:hypothetical protein